MTCAEDNHHLPHCALDLSLRPSPARSASPLFPQCGQPTDSDRRLIADDKVRLLRDVHHQKQRDHDGPDGLLFYRLRRKPRRASRLMASCEFHQSIFFALFSQQIPSYLLEGRKERPPLKQRCYFGAATGQGSFFNLLLLLALVRIRRDAMFYFLERH